MNIKRGKINNKSVCFPKTVNVNEITAPKRINAFEKLDRE